MARGTGEPGRHTGKPDRAVRGLDRLEQPGGVELRRIEQRVEGIDRCGRYLQLREQLQPLRGGAFPHGLRDQPVHRVDLLGAQFQRGVGVGIPGRPHRIDEGAPVLVVVDQRGDEPVLGLVRAPVRCHGARVDRRSDGRVEDGAVGVLDEHEGSHRLEHADLHLLALTGALAVEQRHHGGVQRGQAGDLVGHDGRDVGGIAGQLLLHRGQPALCLDGVVVCGPVGIRATPAVPIAVGVDDLGVDRGDRFVVEPESRYRLGPHGVDEHVRRRDQCAQRRRTLFGAQIQYDTALPAVHIHEHAVHTRGRTHRHVAGDVPFGWLDLDDVGTHVGHDLGAVWAHHHRGDVDDAHPVQRPPMVTHAGPLGMPWRTST